MRRLTRNEEIDHDAPDRLDDVLRSAQAACGSTGIGHHLFAFRDMAGNLPFDAWLAGYSVRGDQRDELRSRRSI
jgi:hypothetical protein